MNKKQEIIKLYYEDDMKIIDIANAVQVSRAYISQVIKLDSRYNDKKEMQKEATQKRKKEYTNNRMKKLREEKRQQDAFIKQQHLQATQELSYGRAIISNRAFRNWNASIYKYNSKSKSYKLRKDILVGLDVPKTIKW